MREYIFIYFHFSKYILKFFSRVSQYYKQDSIEVLKEDKIKNSKVAMDGALNLETIFRRIVKFPWQYSYQTNKSKYNHVAHFFLFYYFYSSKEFSGVLPILLGMPMLLMLRVSVKFWIYLVCVARPLICESWLLWLLWKIGIDS